MRLPSIALELLVSAKKSATGLKLGLAMIAGAMIGTAGMSDIAAYSQDGTVPDKVLLLPFGSNMLGDGRGPFVLRDQKHAEAVVAATKKALGNREFMFDYDHEAMKVTGDEVMGKAVAAGWAKEFAVDDKGIWAVNVKWTPAAEAHIAAHEYRYISPWFIASTKTGDVARLINAALVNRPAFDLEAIAASLSPEEISQTETEDMSLKAIAAALGLAEDATEAAIIAAIGKATGTCTAIAAALNAKEDDDLAAVAAALVVKAGTADDAKPDPKEFVPIAAFEQLQQTVATLNKGRNESLVAAAIREGTLTPAEKQWGTDFIEKYGEDEFVAAMSKRPKIIGDRVVPKGDPKGGEHGLTQEQVDICASMGWDTKAYAEQLKEEQVA